MCNLPIKRKKKSKGQFVHGIPQKGHTEKVEQTKLIGIRIYMLELINPTVLAEYMLNWFDNVLGIFNDKTWKKWRFILN